MSSPKTSRAPRLLAASITGIALGVSVGGCSDIYYAQRDTIALSAGDAIAANEAEQTVDPWPPQSGNRNIGFNGQKMQSAVERYRTNRVIPPVNATTSSVQGAQPQQAAASNEAGSAAPSSASPAPSAQ